ncbi:MAG: enoyl-CoA hydratase/isomerase family protein [Pirellulaceae bacterium]|nr:enoyl-CoA hydratase/isomerase family protein [Planctomycetaceae bacterium]
MPRYLKLNKTQPSGTIVIDRPDKRNALNRVTLVELQQALEDFHLEKSVRAVILTGSGTAFCAGIDLHEIHDTINEDFAWEVWNEDAIIYRQLIEQMLRFPKPIIAAVNGPALGAGAALVMACDLVVAGESATFGIPEARRGLVSGLAMPLTTFRLGASTAARLALTGTVVDATEAHRLGAFHELVGHDQVWARAHELAETVAETASESILLTKRLLNETIGETVLETYLGAAAAASATARTTEAAAEGVQAFLDKRSPDW